MPVMYQLDFDGTESKITGNHVSHTPDIGGDGDAVHERNLKSNSISDRNKAKRNKLDKIDSDLEIVDEVPGDDELDIKLVLEVDTGIATSNDDLDVDLNNNAEKPQMTNQTVQEKSVPSHKIFIKKCKKKNLIDMVVSKNEVTLDIPTLEHGVPKGKAGKHHRILSNEIRENEQAVLQMLEEASKLSTKSSDSETERKRVEKQRKERKIKRSLKSIKSKLAEEHQHREEKARREEKKNRKQKHQQHETTDEEGELHDSSSSGLESSSKSLSSSSDETYMEDEKSMVRLARKGKKTHGKKAALWYIRKVQIH